jgi:hypothetical protein
MTGEDRWRLALEEEAREPSDWDPDLGALEKRLRDHLAMRGCPSPAIAASVVAARAFGHLDRASFARKIGLSVEELRALEGETEDVAGEKKKGEPL